MPLVEEAVRRGSGSSRGVLNKEVPVGRGLGRNQPGDPDMKVLVT